MQQIFLNHNYTNSWIAKDSAVFRWAVSSNLNFIELFLWGNPQNVICTKQLQISYQLYGRIINWK